MAYKQVAALYLRGSLVNKVLKHLTPPQREEIEDIVLMVSADPQLTECKQEFCNALARTIRNDYEQYEAAEQDYMIAIMRAAVAAKYGYGKNPPCHQAITDPMQRKKWFQTWAFNYLRQILRENKLPRYKQTSKYSLPADQAALHMVDQSVKQAIESERDFRQKRALKETYHNAKIYSNNDQHLIKFNHWMFPSQLVENISRIGNEYLTHRIRIILTIDGILIKRPKDVKTIPLTIKSEHLVKMVSFDKDNNREDTGRDHLEATAKPNGGKKMQIEQVVESELLQVLRDRLPKDVLPVFDIYLEETRPLEYIARYGSSRPKIAHISAYLGKPPREIKRMISTIKMHCLALGVGRR